jgi:hypothetical protein
LEDYYINLKADLGESPNNNKEDTNVKLKAKDERPFANFKAYA